MIWEPNEKPKMRNLYWKTLFCCLSDDDGGDDEILMMLWVLCPDDERQEGTEEQHSGRTLLGYSFQGLSEKYSGTASFTCASA